MKNIGRLFCLASLVALGASAQRSPQHPLDIKDADMGKIEKFIDAWLLEEGRPDGVSAIDDQFFISRVRPLPRIVEGDYQVQKQVNRGRKHLLWVPLDDPTTTWKSLPRYCFEGDNFSMWSYVDTHGNWTSPWVRSAAGLTDVAAKNGVTVGCVASIPWANNISLGSMYGHSKLFTVLMQKENGKFKYAAALVKMMKYYGINGLGCNSEFYADEEDMAVIIDFFKTCHREAQKIGWKFEVHWYDGTNESGNISFDRGLGGHNKLMFGDKDNVCATHLFANYNWNGGTLQRSVATAKALGRSSFDYYAGFDIQGRALSNYYWSQLLQNDISIGFWGAHSQSLIHQSATDDGTSDIAIQKAYLNKQELVYSGGNRNPALLPPINMGCTLANSSMEGPTGFHGLATFVSAKSTLQQVPFVSRFNLGNGLQFRNAGKVTFDHKWHNLNTQDFMPTWRWWITNSADKVTSADLAQFVKASLTFDDAYFGGSCLSLKGASPFSRVKLFKSKWTVQPDYELSAVYKTKKGTATHAKLFVALTGQLSTYHEVALPATKAEGEWTTFTVTAKDLGLKANDQIAMLGMVVENSPADYELLVGEMAVRNPKQTFAPVAPTIDEVKVLRGRYNACDFKMRYHSAEDNWNHKVYNDDVDTWYYEIYFQQKDQAPQLLTATTSWAAYVIDAPMVADKNLRTCRFGVRAIAPDGKQASDISWSQWQEVVYNQVCTTIEMSKPVVKPGETFHMRYVDNLAPNAKEWMVVDPLTNKVMARATNSTACEVKIDKVGLYDLKVIDAQNQETWVRGKIQISPETTGAVPMIDTITCALDKADVNEQVSMQFKGRLGEGSVSRALEVTDPKMFMIPGEVQEGKNYSYALWFKVDKFSHDKQGTNLINKNTIADKWPHNNWGDLWVTIRPEWNGHAANEISFNTMGWTAHDSPNEKMMTKDYSVTPGVWNHVVVTHNDQNVQKIYFNGKKMCETTFTASNRRATYGDSRIDRNVVAPIFIGGGGVYKAGFCGWIDEVQVWNKPLSDAEVVEAMQGYAPDQVPEGLQAYYTFEKVEADGSFHNFGHAENAPGKLVAMKNSGGEKTDGASYQPYQPNCEMMGVPSIPGSLPIQTEVAWESEGAQIVKTEGPAAILTYATAGKKAVGLTLTNNWGSDQKLVNEVVEITDVTGIDQVDAAAGLAIYQKAFNDAVTVRFATAGSYEVKIMDLRGVTLQRNALQVEAGAEVNVALQGATGVYLVQVWQGGKLCKTVKVLKR